MLSSFDHKEAKRHKQTNDDDIAYIYYEVDFFNVAIMSVYIIIDHFSFSM